MAAGGWRIEPTLAFSDRTRAEISSTILLSLRMELRFARTGGTFDSAKAFDD
jgi:hypothetical protein